MFSLVNAGTIQVAKSYKVLAFIAFSNIDDFEAIVEVETQGGNFHIYWYGTCHFWGCLFSRRK